MIIALIVASAVVRLPTRASCRHPTWLWERSAAEWQIYINSKLNGLCKIGANIYSVGLRGNDYLTLLPNNEQTMPNKNWLIPNLKAFVLDEVPKVLKMQYVFYRALIEWARTCCSHPLLVPICPAHRLNERLLHQSSCLLSVLTLDSTFTHVKPLNGLHLTISRLICTLNNLSTHQTSSSELSP